jgi:tetratricopeptide (TPR) repeat protein
MSRTNLIVLLLLLALVVAIMLPPVRGFLALQVARLRGRFAPRPRPRTGVTIIAGDGEEFELPLDEEPRPSLIGRAESPGGRRTMAGVVVVLLLLVAAVQLYRLTLAPSPDQFVVLVAPFSEPGGVVGQTGREVAASLVSEIGSATNGRVVARALPDAPADPTAALATLGREGADALIWGEVATGGVLDRESLQPLLIYQPNGRFAPYGWDGYAGRFTMPAAYALSSGQINGRVVLPALLGALADYGAGRIDAAYNTLGQLMADYPALAPTLPRALRGNILWARGQYPQAADEYRGALGSIARDAGPQAAPLYNNLGAILQDAGDAQAPAAFNQAITALDGTDLSALRYNVGIQSLRAGNYDEAITALDIARSPNLLPAATPTSPLLLVLADVYRLGGRFPEAQDTLDQVARQLPDDAAATTAELSNLMRTRLDALLASERALLTLERAAGAYGPLSWEAESSAPLPIRTLDAARGELSQSADDSQVLVQRWSRMSVAKDAAGEPAFGQVATNHALHAQALLRDRRRWMAAVDIERERAQGIQEPRGLGSIWAALAGDRSPMGRARATLEELVASQPADVDSLLFLGRSYLLTGDLDKAGQQFDKAATVAPQRPEPIYGQALVALPGDRGRARQLLARAIALNPAYFPAREKLAAIAEEDNDWAAAIEQRRWLLGNRPSNEARDRTLTLAETLRKSGPSGFVEAEQLLLPLANANDVDALLALSRLYEQRGDTAAARDVLLRATQTAPRNAEPAYQLAQLLERQGDEEGATAEYKRALDVAPSHTPSRLALGGLYAKKGDVGSAAQQYNAALDAGAKDPAALKQIGFVLLANGEYDPAADAFTRAIEVNTDDAELHHGLGQANLGLGKLDAAASEEQRALELREGGYPAALVGLGDVALRSAKPDDAVQQYNAALKLDNRLVEAHIGLGRAAGALGNWSVAEARFRDALAIQPGSAEAHLWLGEALVRKPDPRAAIDEYARAIELRRNYPEAYFGLAQAQLAAGQRDLAAENLASTLTLRPAYPDALLLQGKLYEQESQDDAAIDAYTKSIAANDAMAEPYYRRALVNMRHDRLDPAVNDLEKAVGIQQNFPEAHYWLGRAYLAQGQPKQARAQLIEANAQRPGGYPDARFYQGLAEEQLGMRTDAVASFQAALAQDTGGAWAGDARTALDRLKQP